VSVDPRAIGSSARREGAEGAAGFQQHNEREAVRWYADHAARPSTHGRQQEGPFRACSPAIVSWRKPNRLTGVELLFTPPAYFVDMQCPGATVTGVSLDYLTFLALDRIKRDG